MFEPRQPIYTVAGIRTIEEQVLPEADPPLMERAGRAAAEEAFRLTMDRAGPVLIVCGPGNNGGDGLVMARRLLQAKRPVVVAFGGNAARLPAEARAAFDAWRDAGGTITSDLPAPPPEGWALIADAMFGIGLQRPITGRFADWIASLNTQPAPRLAIDIPSGLDADTGRVLGSAFQATHTLTFIALKPGLLTLDGPDHAGIVTVRPLDLNLDDFPTAEGQRIQPTLFRAYLKPRRLNTHKGSYGSVGVIGGAPGMTGAALLAARAALKLGAGRVYVGLVDAAAPAVDPTQPELMLRDLDCLFEQSTVLAIGPGLGQHADAARLVDRAISSDAPLVIDADGLNLLAAHTELHTRCGLRRAPTLLTPHPAEAGRLLATDTAAVQRDRVMAAVSIARRYGALVALKGCGSVIAAPDGRWFINGTGHPGMATAGMGDILTGQLASLLAQGWDAEAAMLAAVHLHGAAADRLAREGIGPIGLSAGEVAETSRGVFNGWIVQAGASPGH
ncbi:MAG TPA: NAD(P)H-hydrate dehydratase [Rhodocyclaceae bacterium]|nr:NAD(P)H-hydrate dehydratase [Rhodocyclaceae bacterium]